MPQKRRAAHEAVARGDIVTHATSVPVALTRQGDLDMYTLVCSELGDGEVACGVRTPVASSPCFAATTVLSWLLQHLCFLMQDALIVRQRLGQDPAITRLLRRVRMFCARQFCPGTGALFFDASQPLLD